MQLTLVGHATWLIEQGGTRLLTDPVLADPFEDGTVVSCPARAVDVDAMPAPTHIFLSHRHPDHFHPDSLRRLSRDLPVLMPPDPMLAAALARLGFENLVPLRPWGWVEVGDLSVMATSSAGDFPECGLLIRGTDPAGRAVTAYNQVDTPLNREAVERLRAESGGLDVHIAMHASQAFGWFDGVPEELATGHGINLSVARFLGARVVVPGAAGFRFHDDFGWLNAHLFPITSDRFARDLARLSPRQQVLQPLPGQVLEVGGGARIVGESGWAVALEPDQSAIRPDRTGPVPPLTDDGADDPALPARIQALVDDLQAAVVDAWDRDPLLHALRRDGVRYLLRTVRPDGAEQSWTLDLSGPEAQLVPGALDAELSRAVAATAVLDVAEGRHSCFYLRARSRRSQAVLTFDQTIAGLEVDQPNVPDLLSWYLVRRRAAEAGEEGVLRYYGLM